MPPNDQIRARRFTDTDIQSFRSGFPIDAGSYLIAYSGGKNSSVLLDLAIRLHPKKKIIPWHMYTLPGLDITDKLTSWVRDRYSLRLLSVLDYRTSECIRTGAFGHEPEPERALRSLGTVERDVRAETNVIWIGYGYKSIDSVRLHLQLDSCPHGVNYRDLTFSPLKSCGEVMIERYWRERELDSGLGLECNGDGDDDSDSDSDNNGYGNGNGNVQPFGRGYMSWLRDNHANDYLRVTRVFPQLITLE